MYQLVEEKVRKMLDEKRFIHSKNVVKAAVALANKFDLDIEKIKIAAIAHDCAKNFSDDELLKKANYYGIMVDEIQKRCPFLLHGPVGAYICKYEFEIKDEDIFNAIYYHTTGRKGMSIFESIIYLADFISEDRNFEGVDKIRKEAFENFKKALLLSCNSTLTYVIEKNNLIHPLTIEFRNWIILEGENT
ncbi:putative HD superfamily hydrolase of NAD metabolism [Caloramator fervidus]|uniref:bis(5'-nucleosyl)-tetraphosphatase (symmetrical) n=1 Tax=Caloramator fervidus TaxID=29344 RepID=A0A1H5VQQ2_9CLOT|nr:bis(5'-nucleosyl)-tetraphosphatase (symmetrical) YqeK [Caloramator fervidus]SEF89288.1 putative HD superfamily hydrolase of NAD metabolism [Caloramator fervidus]